MQKAVFLDRDGVINSDEGHYYIYKVEDYVINDGIREGLKMLQNAGFLLIVITNQGGVAKGEYSLDDVALVHHHLRSELAKSDIHLTDIYFCPHHESVSQCDCRKPSPKMIVDAMEKYEIDASQSFLIGDSTRDIEAGEKAGLKQCFKIKANSSIILACEQILALSK
jgi:D-glycero-D-manno-heptose 1,7-bisphosphate phosphatase